MLSLKISVFMVCVLAVCVSCKKAKEKPTWATKDIRDFTDADMERLYDQWEEDEDPLDDDELPEHMRPPPPVDMSKIAELGPEGILKQSKKGRTLMTFVSVRGNPTRDHTDEVTKLWQSSLWNNHIQADRFMVDDHRAIFMFKDGSQAWDAKDFLIEQEECEEVVIENKNYYGKFSEKGKEEQAQDASAKTSTKQKEKKNEKSEL